MKRIGIVAVLCLVVVGLCAHCRAEKAMEKTGSCFAGKIAGDFFAGLNGDRAAMDRAMKLCEETLGKDPKNAEAMVWQGAGGVYLSSYAFRGGRTSEGISQWNKGMNRMDEAVALAPANPGVLVPRGVALIQSAEYSPETKRQATKGVKDLETALKLAGANFNTWPPASRGEALSAYSKGLDLLDRTAEAKAVCRRIMDELPGTSYAAAARQHLAR